VHIATHKPTGVHLAIKSIKIYDKNTRDQLKNDLKVLCANKCKNIITFYGAFFTEGNVKIILEYMNLGSLDKTLKIIKTKKVPPPCIPEGILSKITKQILLGLSYLHKEKHQIHRDIKPANILINSDGIVKLTDFGISRSLETTHNLAETFVGSRSYMSPERITGKKYSYPSDIWSLGLVIYELATGEEPYGGGNDFLTQITKIVESPEPRLNSNIFSKEFCDFIEKTVKKEDDKRANIDELINHPWILMHENDEDNIAKWLAFLYDYNYS
jgi:mitogen-activated protein kinase kinase 1